MHPEFPLDHLAREVPRDPAGPCPLYHQWYLKIKRRDRLRYPSRYKIKLISSCNECPLLLSRNILITLRDDRSNGYEKDRVLYVHYCLNDLQWRTMLATFSWWVTPLVLVRKSIVFFKGAVYIWQKNAMKPTCEATSISNGHLYATFPPRIRKDFLPSFCIERYSW